MGGPVKIVIRDPLGVVHKIDAWTGSIPSVFDNWRFFEEDPSIIDLAKEWNDGDMNYLAPGGYGLVLGDMVHKKILTCQGYHYPGKIHSAGYALSIMNKIRSVTDNDIVINVDNLWCAGRIKEIEIYNSKKKCMVRESLEKINTVQEVVEKYGLGNSSFWTFVIDTSPYVIEHFDESSSGLIQMRKRVLELGFELTEEDEKQWSEEIKEKREYEEEEYGEEEQ